MATFEPSGQFCAWLYQYPVLATAYRSLVTGLNWPLQEGRTPLTAMLIPLLAVLCASVFPRWRRRLGSGRSRSNAVILSPAIRRDPAELRDLPKNLCRFGFGCMSSLFGGASVPACGRWDFGSSLQRRYTRLSLRPYALWQQALSILLVVATFCAVTPTEVEAAAQCNPVFWYYHNDHLGSSSIMTDRFGAVVDHYEYYAFGKERYNDSTCSFNVSNRFTGQILDEDTGLYYYGARYYDPEIGRFIQPDSIVPSPGDPQTLNRYSYCGNNPLKYVDPSGHSWLGTAGIIAGSIVALGLTGLLWAAIGGAAGGAALGSITAAATGQDVGQGAQSGAISGAGQNAFGFAGVVAAGAINARLAGGNAGRGAGAAAAGYAVGAAVSLLTMGMGLVVVQVLVSVGSGALSGGVASVVQGGRFGQGAAYGAAGAAIAFAVTLATCAGVDYIAQEVIMDHGGPASGGGSMERNKLDYEMVKDMLANNRSDLPDIQKQIDLWLEGKDVVIKEAGLTGYGAASLPRNTATGKYEIFIDPFKVDQQHLAGVLIHELTHVLDKMAGKIQATLSKEQRAFDAQFSLESHLKLPFARKWTMAEIKAHPLYKHLPP